MSAPAPLDGLVQLVHPGHRFMLGSWAGGGYAIWTIAGGQPVATFPVSMGDPSAAAMAWDAASRTWAAWENPAPLYHAPPPGWPAPRGGLGGAGAAAIIIFILAVFYFAAHAYVYRNCVVTPDLTAWPRACL